jgi:hypothetical protein
LTPAEIETQVRARYNASGDPHFTSAEIRNCIWQAEMELALEAFVIESTTTTASVANTQTIAYPTNCIAVRRLEYDGKKIRVSSLEADPKTSTTQVYGTPGEYAIWNDTIYLYPTPDAVKTVKIFHYNQPTEVTTSSTTMSVPVRYHTDIIDYCLSIMYAKDQNTQMATYHRNQWESNVSKIKRNRKKEKSSDGFAVVKEFGVNDGYNGVDL